MVLALAVAVMVLVIISATIDACVIAAIGVAAIRNPAIEHPASVGTDIIEFAVVGRLKMQTGAVSWAGRLPATLLLPDDLKDGGEHDQHTSECTTCTRKAPDLPPSPSRSLLLSASTCVNCACEIGCITWNVVGVADLALLGKCKTCPRTRG